MIRDATLEETADIWPGGQTWVAVLEKDGEIKGHVCLTRQGDQVFGHDMVCETGDEFDPLRLWRFAKKHALTEGYDCVHIHVEIGTPKRILDFWQDQGATPVFTVFRLMLN